MFDDPPHLHSFPTRRSSDLTTELCLGRSSRVRRAAATPRACSATPPATSRTKLSGHWSGGAHSMNWADRKSTRLNSSHSQISYAVFCLKKKTDHQYHVVLYK